jgi:alpha-tubulin suppressor-like RCC1 family protein
MVRPLARTSFLLGIFATLLFILSGRAVAQLSSVATRVGAGETHSCALLGNGGVQCWGGNVLGQLGDNTNSDSPIPVNVSGVGGIGLLAGIATIAVGGAHSCALNTVGGVQCWGDNSSGQLGDGSVAIRLTPVDVLGLTSGVAAISAGETHSCALTTAGGVKCWGQNFVGELGNNSTTGSPLPVDVTGLTSGVAAISAGYLMTCAVTTAGGAKCWGGNFQGVLGDGTTANRSTPVDVSGLTTGVAAITATGGGTSCAITTTGGLKCWGYNGWGGVGDGTTVTPRLVPVDVSGLSTGVVAVTSGEMFVCALTTSDGMKCWGSNPYGQLGNGSNAQRLTPIDVFGLQNGVAGIAAGFDHTCALTKSGRPMCWGHSPYGGVGDGTTATDPNLPKRVSGFTTYDVAKLALGESHTCALTDAGGVKCWGFNNQGELGNNSIAQSLVPVDVTGLTSGAASIGASKFHSCAVTTGGAVQCWGQNTSGSLGDGTQTERHVPTNVFGLTSGYSTVSLGSNHSCALSAVGGTMCWGGNSVGVLGDGTYNQQLLPVSVQQTVNFLAISAGDSVTCARALGGFTQCWGANNAGQLGQGVINSPIKINVPGTVPGLPDTSAIDAGGDHTCVRTLGSNGLKCWGANAEGQLGDGSILSRPSPVDVTGLTSGVLAVAAGTVHTCAVTNSGGVKCWGNNFFSQLGDGTSTGRPSPVDVVGLASGAVSIEAGVGHTCALTIAGDVKCWGHNLNGQLGDNSTTPRLTPVIALVGGQSIAFTPPAKLAPGASVTLTATATSGLPVTFDTWTPGTCTITGNTVMAIAQSVCGIRASQPGNANIPPAPQVLRLMSTSQVPVLVSAVSRKLHGGAGTFDLALSAVTTNPTTEPRQGTAQTIVMTFDKPINAATVTITEGTATAATPTFSGNDVVVGLTGVVDQQYVTIALTNVVSTDGGTGGSGSVRLGFLAGDVNGSRVVSIADLGLVNAQLSQVVTAANFLKDVNANGTLTLSDKGITNAALTRALPPP